jgi:hypothetical protein
MIRKEDIDELEQSFKSIFDVVDQTVKNRLVSAIKNLRDLVDMDEALHPQVVTKSEEKPVVVEDTIKIIKKKIKEEPKHEAPDAV